MNHIVGAIRQVFYLQCGKCAHQWQEKGSNELRNGVEIPVQEGQELECPACNKELVIKFDYQPNM